jgi:hypothetical protein
MRDCAYEASVALSAFAQVSRMHTALTSECGSMLEEVQSLQHLMLPCITKDCNSELIFFLVYRI